MSAVAPYVRRHVWGVLIAVAFLMVETVAELAQPALMAEVEDAGVASADVGCILRYGVLMVAVAAAGAVGAVVRNNVSQRVSQSIGREMRDDLYAKVQTLSFQNIDRLQTASIITRLTNDVNAVVMFVCSLMRIAVKMPLTCAGAIVLIVYHTPEFAPLMVAVVATVAGLVALKQVWVAAEEPDAGEKFAPAAGRPAVNGDPAARPSAAAGCSAQAPAVAFDRVSFSYAGSSRPALDDVSFAVPQGGSLGIIGPTGSGKSTLASLVARFYDACGGEVALFGRDVTAVPEAEVRAAVAVVPQASKLFSGTVAENLRWGDPDADDDALCRAARIAQAHGFVERLAGGYGAQLGQGGVNLSSGQRQRLCLARALVRRPRVLVLDDCTSALDAATERAVLDGLAAHLAGTAVLLVSQRIATVRRADRILRLEEGRVQGLGSHEELLASCPTYRAIYESQIGPAPVSVCAPAPAPAKEVCHG